MSDKVKEALDILAQYTRRKRNSLGDYWADSMAADCLAVVHAHIVGLRAEVEDLENLVIELQEKQ